MTIPDPKKSKSLVLIMSLLITITAALTMILVLKDYNKPKPVVNTNNNQQTNNIPDKKPQPIISGWNVYENKKYGLRVDYPKDWTAKETGEYTAISLVSSETQKYFEENFEQIKDFYVGNFNEYFAYNSDVSIYCYASLEDRHGVATIKEWIENNNEITSIGKIQISGIEATELVLQGERELYTIIFENNGYFYEIALNGTSGKENISDTIKQILSTFQLIK